MLPDTFPWWGLLALATAAFTDVVTDLLPSGLLPQMSRALHVPEARIGLLVSAFAGFDVWTRIHVGPVSAQLVIMGFVCTTAAIGILNNVWRVARREGARVALRGSVLRCRPSHPGPASRPGARSSHPGGRGPFS